MKVSVPFSAPALEPVHGASKKCTPLDWPDAFEQAVLTSADRARHRGGADAIENEIGLLGHFLGRGAGDALALLRKFLRLAV
jgi:hypothetical protein